MQDLKGNFIQAYPDCKNLKKVIKGLDREKVNMVKISATLVKKCSLS